MGAEMRRPMSIAVASLFAAGWTMAQGFCFVPALKSGVGVAFGNERRSTSRCQSATERDVAERGLTMRGLHKKGKNGPGLTGVQRVLNTRERIRETDDPCKVMISNLDYSLTEEDVQVFCSSAGPVTAVKLIKKRYAKTSKGYGFVDFDQPLTATIAIEDLNGTEINGRVVELKPAVTTREKLRRQASMEWEETEALERERRAAAGYTNEMGEDTELEGEEEEDGLAPTKAAKQTGEGSMPNYAAFRELISPRVKKKPTGFQ